jgi:PPM family protein phosphatase
MQIEVGQGTHTGLRRAHNEDTLLAAPELGLWIVADGMGGLDSGEVASAMARDCVLREVRAGTPLVRAIEIAHTALLNHIDEVNPAKRMGTTIVALKIDPPSADAQNGTSEQASDAEPMAFEIAWVGDSRIYQQDSNFVLKQISHDHSYVQELLDRNLITADEARRSPHKNLVTQALGAVAEKELKVDSAKGVLKAGGQILLCTDGLTGEVDDDGICDILTDESHCQDAVDALIQAALNGGGNDNITVVVLRAPRVVASV